MCEQEEIFFFAIRELPYKLTKYHSESLTERPKTFHRKLNRPVVAVWGFPSSYQSISQQHFLSSFRVVGPFGHHKISMILYGRIYKNPSQYMGSIWMVFFLQAIHVDPSRCSFNSRIEISYRSENRTGTGSGWIPQPFTGKPVGNDCCEQ